MTRLAVLVVAAAIGLAEAPYNGTWKYNDAKSDLGVQEVSFKQLEGGAWQQTDQRGRSFTFRFDGKAYPDQVGTMVTMRQVNASTWEATNRLNGQVAGTDRFTLSPDGNTLKIVSQLGTTAQATLELQRAGAGSGFEGTWRGDRAHLSPFDMEIAVTGDDDIAVRIPGAIECRARFDGKPYPVSGAQAAPGMTASFTKKGPRAFGMQQQTKEGTFDVTMTVSEDGKTLTETGIEGNLRRTWVFDRQP